MRVWSEAKEYLHTAEPYLIGFAAGWLVKAGRLDFVLFLVGGYVIYRVFIRKG